MDEKHERAIELLCRVCGQRCLKYHQSSKKTGLKKDVHAGCLLQSYNIDITKDVITTHPIHICNSCVASFGKKSPRPVVQWRSHDGGTCTACNLLEKTGFRSGRRPKPAAIGARRRKEKEMAIKNAHDVDAACAFLLTTTPSADQPPCKKLQQVATVVLRQMLHSSNNDVVTLPTCGPKLTVQRVVTPRVPSSLASQRTVTSRTKYLKQHMTTISGHAEAEQFAALVNQYPKAELQTLLKSHGLLRIRIPPGHELAMKARLGWSWAIMRKMKIWLKAYNVSMVCEAHSRQRKEKLLGNPLKSEMRPFIVKDGEEHVTQLKPIVFIQDLQHHIIKTLDELDRCNLLVWESIPEDEIWLKIGGDQGGGTTKFYFQVANVSSANSPYNTTCFCVFVADESVSNLHIALDQYVAQINSLQQMQWRNNRIVVWLCGDYEIERKLLGLQGTSATYPCTSCRIKKNGLGTEVNAEPRTIDNIMADYHAAEADNLTAEAKRLNYSVSHKRFFNIPIEQVCPPGLHISLGLWHKFYSNLEHGLQVLGQMIVEHQAEETADSSTLATTDNFQDHVRRTRKMLLNVQALEQQAEDMRQQAIDLEYDLITQSLVSEPNPNLEQMTDIEKLHKQATELDTKAQDLRKQNKLSLETNPLIQRLDQTLQGFKVRRQAYYSIIC